jgi:hypothetical protein
MASPPESSPEKPDEGPLFEGDDGDIIVIDADKLPAAPPPSPEEEQKRRERLKKWYDEKIAPWLPKPPSTPEQA